jgi:hypothetical protein
MTAPFDIQGTGDVLDTAARQNLGFARIFIPWLRASDREMAFCGFAVTSPLFLRAWENVSRPTHRRGKWMAGQHRGAGESTKGVAVESRRSGKSATMGKWYCGQTQE